MFFLGINELSKLLSKAKAFIPKKNYMKIWQFFLKLFKLAPSN